VLELSQPIGPAMDVERPEFTATTDVLHVPFGYFPDPVGGTEIYVAGLVAALRARGLEGVVAAPGESNAVYVYDQVPVFRFARAASPTFASAYGAPDEDAAVSFRAVLAQVRPSIVHLHARTAAVSDRLIDAAREHGAKVVFTYHTPTVSCARGSMVQLGRTICDGKLDVRRCTTCVLQNYGVPPVVRDALASTPQVLGEALGRAGLSGGAFTALRMSALVGASHRHFGYLIQKIDCIVAVCRWVADVLRVNGVPESKLALCRQGLPCRRIADEWGTSRAPPECDGALRLGYFGRLDQHKGVDLLIEALRRVPHAKVRLNIYGVLQPGSNAYAARLKDAAAADHRVSMKAALPPDMVLDAMRRCDFVAVPSRGLETGPLVALESFAAGTPVLGTRLGGIAELVTDGVDGILVAPDDPAAWSLTIAELTGNPDRVSRLRAGVRAPRTMDDVAGEMAALYGAMLDDDPP
jgi:glycosyltransferase involved in cell wall biosynthesis